MCMYVQIYIYVEIKRVVLSNVVRKMSPEVHHLLHMQQFYLPRPRTLPLLTVSAINFSITLLQYIFSLVLVYAQRRLI